MYGLGTYGQVRRAGYARRYERARSVSRVWFGSRDGLKDGEVLGAPWVSGCSNLPTEPPSHG